MINTNFKTVLNHALEKIEHSAYKLSDFPHATGNGYWQPTPVDFWAGGFWIGLLWLAYTVNQEKRYKRWAYKWIRLLEPWKNHKSFNVGFLFYPSFVLGYKITKDDRFRNTSLAVADKLITFFNKESGFIYDEIVLNNKSIGRTAIDVMMNLPLLWWAYEETGDDRHYDVAYIHSKRTIEKFIRKDYSTIHVIDFDLGTGEIIRKVTLQGYSNDSCWSRGQAWAIYGFTLAYKYTEDELFLRTAENLAEYFLKNLPEDYVPQWDFNDPEKERRDSSAAAIASSALLELSALSGKEEFKAVAINILSSLCNNYLSGKEDDGILAHGCFYKPAETGVDESLIWGDYYFMEAIKKVIKDEGMEVK